MVPSLQEWGLLAAFPDRGVWSWSLGLSVVVRDGRGPAVEFAQYMVCLVRVLGWGSSEPRLYGPRGLVAGGLR